MVCVKYALANRMTANQNKLRRSSVLLNILRGCEFVQAITRAECMRSD